MKVRTAMTDLKVVANGRPFRLATMVAIAMAIFFIEISTAQAATISWRSRPFINEGGALKNQTGTGQLGSTQGELIYAENTGGAATVFDGISYSAGAINFGNSLSVFHDAVASSPLSHDATFDPDATGLSTVTLGTGGVGGPLTIGVRYGIELLLVDTRAGANGRTVSVDGINQGVYANGEAGVTFGDSLLITGIFTADATSQTFTIETFLLGDTRGAQLNGLLLFEAVVPEPSTGLLLSFGLFGLVMRRKTRSRVEG